MMKVLVTGKNSYAGTQFAKRMIELNKGWQIDFVSVRDNSWQEESFSEYDAVYHVAGIVHKKETTKNKDLYYKVNRDLTNQLAVKAKNEGVNSFVFLSTMAVYGLIGKIGEDTIISNETKAAPTSHYGKSKIEAEELLEVLKSPEFNISILRIPMIYGPDCPGNYKSLSKLARMTPIFPKINNRRSMIFVDHLSDIVSYIMEEKLSGILLVKNPEDINTLEMISEIRRNHEKKTYNSNLLAIAIKRIGNNFMVSRKMFGTIYYQTLASEIMGFQYTDIDFKKTISITEKKII